MLFDSFEGYDVPETRRKCKEQINQLTLKLIDEDRLEDLKRAAKDPEYQEQLLKEYGL